MPIIVTDCPRCDARNMTFDVQGFNFLGRSKPTGNVPTPWQRRYELFCICGACRRATTFVVEQRSDNLGQVLHNSAAIMTAFGAESLEIRFKVVGHINIRNMATQAPPEYLPDGIRDGFNEAATCLAVECWNAAGLMFRKCVDLATYGLLPEEDTAGLNRHKRRNLAARLEWLFEQQLMPRDLETLSDCIREDGNDGAHGNPLKKEDAEDLLDFTTAVLERLYTEPKKLEQAKERREQRRSH